MCSQAELGNKTASRTKRRPGVILAAVLISLFVVLLVGAQLTRAIVTHHRQTHLAEPQQQSFWLAESAIQRAAHALAKSPDYEGETWRVPAEVLGAGSPGVAIIQVEPAADPDSGRVIRIQAYYPEDGAHRILHEREMSVNLPSPGGSP